MGEEIFYRKQERWLGVLYFVPSDSSSDQKGGAHRSAHTQTLVSLLSLLMETLYISIVENKREGGGVKSESVERFFLFDVDVGVCVEIQIEGTRRLGKDEDGCAR